MSIFARLLACLAVLAMVAAFAQATYAQTPAADATTTAVEDPGFASRPVEIEHPTNSRQRMEFTVIRVADPMPEVRALHRGFRVIGVELLMRNVGNEAFDLSESDVVLLDDVGASAFRTYRFDLGTRDSFSFQELAPGKTHRGWLVYELFVDAKIHSVAFWGYDDDPHFQVLAQLEPIADGVVIRGWDGEPLATMTVETYITNFEDVDDSITAYRTFSITAAVVRIDNIGNDIFPVGASDIWAIDQYGVWHEWRPLAVGGSPPANIPVLTTKVAAGESIAGVVVFEISPGVHLRQIVYDPDFAGTFLIGQAEPVLTITGSEAKDALVIANPGEQALNCAGASEWLSGANAVLALEAAMFDDVLALLETGDLELAQTVTESIRYLHRLQTERVDAPEAAAEAHSALIQYLKLSADEAEQIIADVKEGDAVAELVAEQHRDTSARRTALFNLNLLISDSSRYCQV